GRVAAIVAAGAAFEIACALVPAGRRNRLRRGRRCCEREGRSSKREYGDLPHVHLPLARRGRLMRLFLQGNSPPARERWCPPRSEYRDADKWRRARVASVRPSRSDMLEDRRPDRRTARTPACTPPGRPPNTPPVLPPFVRQLVIIVAQSPDRKSTRLNS